MKLQDMPPIRQSINAIGKLKRLRKFHKTIEGSLKWHHDEHDPEEAERTTPPIDENIQLQSIWITEACPPSMINGLFASLKSHGWNNSERNLRSDTNLSDWIRQSRSTGNLSSWNNAGILLRAGDTRFSVGGNVRRCKLPSVVDYGYLSVRNITSSLTLVTIQFVLQADSASMLNSILAKQYKTKVEHFPSKWFPKNATYIDIAEQKRRAVDRAMSSVHESLYGWFRSNLPGYFAATKPHKPYPTVDFITSNKYKYPKKDERQAKDTYFDLLFSRSSEIWNCQDIAGLELRHSYSQRNEFSFAVFGKLGKLSKGTERYGNGLIGMMQDYFDVTMSRWAVHNMLASYEHDLSAIRDKASSKKKSARKTLDDLSYIREEFLAISTDAQIVSRDLLNTIKSGNRFYNSERLNFSPPFYLPNDYPDYMEMLRRRDESRIEQLTILEGHVRDAVVSGGNIASAISNLRIQRYVFWLTVVAAVLAAISVRSAIASAVVAVYHFIINLI